MMFAFIVGAIVKAALLPAMNQGAGAESYHGCQLTGSAGMTNSVAVVDLAFGADGQTLAARTKDNDVYMASDTFLQLRSVAYDDSVTGKRSQKLNAVALFPCNQQIALVGYRDNLIMALNAKDGQEICAVPVNQEKDAVNCLALSPNGERVAALYDSYKLRIWDAHSKKVLNTLNIEQDRRTRVFDQESLPSFVLAFSSDGAMLAAPQLGWNICVWDLATGKPACELRALRAAVGRLAFAPRRDAIAFTYADLYHSQNKDTSIHLHRVSDGKELLILEGHRDLVSAIDFAASLPLLASGGRDGSARLWEVASGKEVGRIEFAKCTVRSIRFSPDGRLVAVGLSDGRCIIWKHGVATTKTNTTSTVTQTDIDDIWKRLAASDAKDAYHAVLSLSSSGNRALDFLRDHLSPITPANLTNISRMISDLDHDDFARRDAASSELAKLINQAEPLLREALETTKSPEQAKRLKTLLKGRETWAIQDPELLQAVRAIWVLQRIGTPEAKALVEKLAAGAPTARQTQEAQAALDFLKKTKGR